MRTCEYCGKLLVGRNKKARFCNSACRSKNYRRKNKHKEIDVSPFPKWDKPLIMEGDAVVMGDLEIPFHHAQFVNQVLEVAESWGITQCILAGDQLHLEALSAWQPHWIEPSVDMAELMESMYIAIQDEESGEALRIWEEIEQGMVSGAPNFSRELLIARDVLGVLGERFDLIHFVLGNHEGRLIRTLSTVLSPTDLLALLKLDEKWKISPYYYGILESNGETYRVTHPKSAAQIAVRKLASKFLMHILMGHSHALTMRRDISDSFWACEIGCCVDEERLAYVGQRDNTARAHSLGAAIVRDGHLWLLHPWVDWERLKGMA